MNRQIVIAAAIATLVAGAASAQHPAAPTQGPQAATGANLQGDDSAWRRDQHIRAFYDLTVQAFAKGPAKLDVESYESKAYAIFRDFGPAMGMSPEAMQDHLKLIPRQVVGIVKDDPKTLDSLDNFVLAIFGPK